MSVEPAVMRSRSAIAQPVRQGGVRINDVVKIYGARDTGILAVDHCTFEVPPGGTQAGWNLSLMVRHLS